ncbi:hypothetical protein ACQ4PT_032779 [Festuca glaucescens]
MVSRPRPARSTGRSRSPARSPSYPATSPSSPSRPSSPSSSHSDEDVEDSLTTFTAARLDAAPASSSVSPPKPDSSSVSVKRPPTASARMASNARTHKSMIVIRYNNVVGGITYHPYARLNTLAAMEPFVVSTNRHLSVMHPVHKLLSPHYRDTMTTNALARQRLINAFYAAVN